MTKPQISIVLPVHNERDNLDPLLDEIAAAMRSFGRSYEVIAVDDGSTDGSDAVLLRRTKTDPRLHVLRFGRNFGQSAAFDAGFCRAEAPLIVTLDADGQNDPADIPKLVRHLEENSLDFVSGRRANRKDPALFRKLPSRIANFIIRAATHTKITDLGCSLKVYRAEVVREVRLYGEMHRFLAVLIEGTGARVGQVDVNHRPRLKGRSNYGLSRTFKVLLDLVTVWFMRAFQTSPIYAFGGIGAALMTGALGLSAYVLYDKFVNHVWVHRNPVFALSMVMAIIAVQFIAMGIFAEFMIRTYFEGRGRPPYYIIADVRYPETHTARETHDPQTTGRDA